MLVVRMRWIATTPGFSRGTAFSTCFRSQCEVSSYTVSHFVTPNCSAEGNRVHVTFALGSDRIRRQGFNHRSKVLFAISVHDGLLEYAERGGGGLKIEVSFSGLVQRVANVLGHQAQEKMRSEVSRSHTGRDSFHHRTSGNTICQNRDSFVVVKSAGVDQGQRLSERHRLHRRQKIVDQLHERTASVRPKVNRVPAEC